MSELHKTLRLVFRELVEDGVINENPCDQMETPRRDTQERSAVRPSAVRRFVSELDLASEDEFGYFLAVVMGPTAERSAPCRGATWTTSSRPFPSGTTSTTSATSRSPRPTRA